MKERSNSGSSAYTPNMDMPSRKKGNRALTGLVLTLLLPPIGLIYLWRESVFRTRGRMLLTCIANLEMALFVALVMPAPDMNMEAPMPVAPVAATIAPDDGVVTALSNIDQLLAQQQAERDAAAGIASPEPTVDNAAYMAEQQAILETTVYSVYGDGARYYHKDSVCGTQSNRRALTVREAMGEGMGACAECDPPVYIG
ncbi:MAG: hypothetical protein IJ508_06055 [Oscillospiraceae bacterium]|nr:hypothetical protein [Oscillospiraceae bacterium]